MSTTYRLVIVGGGTAGITVAARMARHLPAGSIALVEPSDKHYYQPIWTLVGAGEATAAQSVRNEADFIPKGVDWIRQPVASLAPDRNAVVLADGTELSYETLVLAPGIRVDVEAIPGLAEALKEDPRVSTNYLFETAEKTYRAIQAFRGGAAIFTHPAGPVKCAGAPQKIMYLAEDYWQRHGVRDKAQIHGYFALGSIFGIPGYRPALEAVVARKGISMHFERDLIEVRHSTSEAVFRSVTDPSVTETVHYDFMHATPKMKPHDFVVASPLSVGEGPTNGFVDVDIETLQSKHFPNVFALGDAAALPTSKTGAAVRKQAVVLEANLLAFWKGLPLPKKYNGYTSCPIPTGYGRLILAEFGYEDKLMPSFPLDPTKERWTMYMLKKHGLPRLYWDLMLRGRA